MNNQLLPVALQPEEMDVLFQAVEENPDTQIKVNLPNQTIEVAGQQFSFEIEAHHKDNMIKGLDAIGQTLESSNSIDQYEKKIPAWL